MDRKDQGTGDCGPHRRIFETHLALRAVEGVPVRDEADMLAKFGPSAKTKASLILLDSHGKEFSSEQFAKFMGDYQERNPLPLVLAIGGADGFGAESRDAAQHIIS